MVIVPVVVDAPMVYVEPATPSSEKFPVPTKSDKLVAPVVLPKVLTDAPAVANVVAPVEVSVEKTPAAPDASKRFQVAKLLIIEVKTHDLLTATPELSTGSIHKVPKGALSALVGAIFATIGDGGITGNASDKP